MLSPSFPIMCPWKPVFLSLAFCSMFSLASFSGTTAAEPAAARASGAPSASKARGSVAAGRSDRRAGRRHDAGGRGAEPCAHPRTAPRPPLLGQRARPRGRHGALGRLAPVAAAATSRLGARRAARSPGRLRLHDSHVADLLDQAVFHVEHVRLAPPSRSRGLVSRGHPQGPKARRDQQPDHDHDGHGHDHRGREPGELRDVPSTEP
jgi:hypothetical protein